MKRATLLLGLSLALLSVTASADDLIERGRYLARISGCNDCHTAGYPEAAGKVPEAKWLTGSSVGFSGPWGVTYPANLRLVLGAIAEAEWMQRARMPLRPPMPWFMLRDMSDDDLRAIYRFVRSLGPAGTPAPSYVPPNELPRTPYIVFVPQSLAGTASGTTTR